MLKTSVLFTAFLILTCQITFGEHPHRVVWEGDSGPGKG